MTELPQQLLETIAWCPQGALYFMNENEVPQ